jgi:fluoroquinolone resistance protein
MLSESLNLEIWDRLLAGKPLDGLGLETRDGLIDARGLELPEPTVLRRFQFRGMSVAATDSGIVQGVKWRNLDFSDSKLAGLRLMRGLVENCRFDDCNLQGVRIWATSFRDVSFKGVNLRGSVLGGAHEGVRNSFIGVDFSEANLSGTIYQAAAFERCTFSNAKLTKIDFQSSTFKDCRFEGELNDVLFYRHGFKGEQYPPNEMVNVDFTRAKLRSVGFRKLLLDRVRFPQDDEHVVIKNFARSIDLMIKLLSQQNDAVGKKLVAFLRIDREWVLPNQAQGVINIKQMAGLVGEEGVNRFIAAIPPGARVES